MINISIEINNINNCLSRQPIEHTKNTRYMTLELHLIAWETPKYVTGI